MTIGPLATGVAMRLHYGIPARWLPGTPREAPRDLALESRQHRGRTLQSAAAFPRVPTGARARAPSMPTCRRRRTLASVLAIATVLPGSARGTLRDANGRPVAGRAVVATPLLAGQGEVVATTDAAGVFVLRHLPRGELRIVAAIPGQGLMRLDFLATADASVTLAPWLGPTRTLHISVADLAPDLAASTIVHVRPTTAYGWPLEWQRPALALDGSCALDLPDSSARAAAPFALSAGGHYSVDLTVDLP